MTEMSQQQGNQA